MRHPRGQVLAMIAATMALGCSGAPRANVPTVTSSPPTASATSTPTPPTPTPSPVPTPTAAAVRYVAIGASDTVGVGASHPAAAWPDRIATRLPGASTYVNLGVSGSLAADARAQQLPRAIDAKPTLVTLWLAVNDMNAAVPVATYGLALRDIIDSLVARTEARIFVGNIPDVRSVPAYAAVDKTLLLAQIEAYNRAIAEVAARAPERVTVVDLFTGSAELASSVTVAQDGFHPSDRGYELIADRFIAALRLAGIPLRV